MGKPRFSLFACLLWPPPPIRPGAPFGSLARHHHHHHRTHHHPSTRPPVHPPAPPHRVAYSSVRPRGRPRSLADSEKLLVGYRYYDYHNISFTNGFPFGHGLSYTEFRYSGLAVVKDEAGNPSQVTVKIENAGKVFTATST